MGLCRVNQRLHAPGLQVGVPIRTTDTTPDPWKKWLKSPLDQTAWRYPQTPVQRAEACSTASIRGPADRFLRASYPLRQAGLISVARPPQSRIPYLGFLLSCLSKLLDGYLYCASQRNHDGFARPPMRWSLAGCASGCFDGEPGAL